MYSGVFATLLFVFLSVFRLFAACGFLLVFAWLSFFVRRGRRGSAPWWPSASTHMQRCLPRLAQAYTSLSLLGNFWFPPYAVFPVFPVCFRPPVYPVFPVFPIFPPFFLVFSIFFVFPRFHCFSCFPAFPISWWHPCLFSSTYYSNYASLRGCVYDHIHFSYSSVGDGEMATPFLF